jgi:general secretion pathway protein D
LATLQRAIHKKLVLSFLLSLCLSACVSNEYGVNDLSVLDRKLESQPAGKNNRGGARVENANPDQSEYGFNGFEKLGTDGLTGKAHRIEVIDGDEPADLRLNLLDVPVAVASKAVLSDVMGLSYAIDPRVQGNVTIETAEGVSKRELLRLFQGALRGLGATIVGRNKSFRIVPLDEGAKSLPAFDDGETEFSNPGQRAKVVPLKYVSASEIADIIAPMVPSSMLMRVDRQRNALLLSGSAQEISALRDTIAVFDVDWMKGMSFALVPLRSSQPSALVGDLEQIFNTKKGPLRDVLRFIPNGRLKSVLVVSSRAKYIAEARDWIRKLDVLAEGNEESLHVYKVQNRTATELAKVLQNVLAAENGSVSKRQKNQQTVAPKLQEAASGESDTPYITGGPETPDSGLGSDADVQRELAENTFEATVETSEGKSRIRVVADDANNSLLIFSSRLEFDRLQSVLQQIDDQPNQVLLEAVIAEVSLDDELKFGVRWRLGKDNNNGTFSDLLSGAAASSFPGFSYFLKGNDIGFTLNALASVTDVRVLSSPSLMVLDNKTATLQVGDQVPIVSQQAKGTSTADAPIVNAVELKDTGVILKVTPRVNDSGRVILDIEQEVSNVVKTTTSGIDSPTIRQRKISTSVVLSDGEAMALGGLIQERETTGQAKVPVLGDVPILKNAFRQKTNGVSRTELIIFIRPRVVRDMDEARDITEEFRSQLEILAPRVRRVEPTPGQELVRVLN